MIDHYLSIWEVAHRWRNVNPDKSDPTDLPLNIQDTIRYICRGALNGNLYLFYLVTEEILPSDNSHGFTSQVRAYHVNEFPFDLSESLSRKYDKAMLDAYFVEAENLFDYCLHDQRTGTITTVDFPSCWSHLVGGGTPIENESDDVEFPLILKSLLPVQIDKLVCQAIAKTLWDVFPTMTITAMSHHPAVLEYGGGKLYPGKNTLLGWVREVAPKNVRNKPGRPKNSKPSNDAA